jgi:hypothetical protein
MRAMPTGPQQVNNRKTRKLFGLDGTNFNECVTEKLKDMQAFGLVTAWDITAVAGRTIMRVWLTDLSELEVPEAALDMPEKNKKSDAEIIWRDWADWAADKLNIKEWQPTLKERSLLKRLLKISDRKVVRAAVKLYWKRKADTRNRSNFTEFYKRFDALQNWVLDEEEVKKANAYEEPTRDSSYYYKRELKRAEKRGDEKAVARYKRLLEKATHGKEE